MVVRADVTAKSELSQETGLIGLRGPFEKVVRAELKYVPIGLKHGERERGNHVMLLCAVTNELASDVGVLIISEGCEQICEGNLKLKTDAQEMF